MFCQMHLVLAALALLGLTLAGAHAGDAPPSSLAKKHLQANPILKDTRGLEIPEPIRQRALGAFMGVLYGDAAGAFCEGHRLPTREQVVKAMNMSGGPPRKGSDQVRGPGQVTDDGEQTMGVADVLAASTNDCVDPEDFLTAFLLWGKTGHGMGRQTRKALALGNKTAEKWDRLLKANATCKLHKMSRYATHVTTVFNSDKKDKIRSEANGAIMRAIPLAIWGYDLTADQLYDLVKKAAKVSHSTHAAHLAEAYYVIVAAKLIKTGDTNFALQEANDWFKRVESRMFWCSQKSAYKKMTQWLDEAASLSENNYQLPEEYSANNFQSMGWVRWGFTLAIGHLLGGSKLENAVENAITQGGDTDTNAAIIGGLLGAGQGLSAIPDSALDVLLSRGKRSEGITVPSHFYTEAALGKADALLAAHARGEHYHDYGDD
eukprot:GHVT01085862.1.p1 GENE.GHVT01085862.1~~GHVT01085862.1.p1  ORF type:complete len:433 (+),score=52.14 GHVT01085862.1:105-1403(+)